MTLFRPEVIDAQRRRVYGDVTLHQPARLAAFALVAVIGVASATAFLAIGTFARKETVAGWVVPSGDLASVSAPRGGLVAAVSVAQGDYVQRGQTLVVLDMGAQGGSVWGNRVPVTSSLLIAPLDGQVASVTARVGVEALPNLPPPTPAPKIHPKNPPKYSPTKKCSNPTSHNLTDAPPPCVNRGAVKRARVLAMGPIAVSGDREIVRCVH